MLWSRHRPLELSHLEARDQDLYLVSDQFLDRGHSQGWIVILSKETLRLRAIRGKEQPGESLGSRGGVGWPSVSKTEPGFFFLR